MKLFIFRHEIAVDRENFDDMDDSQRPLTEKGIKRARKSSFAFKKLVSEIDNIYTSPYLRALQTALPYKDLFESAHFSEEKWLTPGSNPEKVLEALNELSDKKILLFSHEPLVGLLASYSLSGKMHNFINFKKGTFLHLEFPFGVRPGEAYLNWMVTSGTVKKLKG